MHRYFAFVAMLLAISSSAVAATPAPPWKTPKSDFGGAQPLNIRNWFTFMDYPSEALETNEQGLVTVAFTITAEGRVSDCQVTRSSGHDDLDAVPCKLLIARAQFKPAVDAQGRPKATRGSTYMEFWLPYN